MFSTRKVKKGDLVHNHNGHSYEVLSTRVRHPKYRGEKQDLLLRDTLTNKIVVANGWNCDSHRNERKGEWDFGHYYQSLDGFSKKDFKKLQNRFKGHFSKPRKKITKYQIVLPNKEVLTCNEKEFSNRKEFMKNRNDWKKSKNIRVIDTYSKKSWFDEKPSRN